MAKEQYYINDYLNRNSKTVLYHLNEDSEKIGLEDLKAMLARENIMAGRLEVLDALNILINKKENNRTTEAVTMAKKVKDNLVEDPVPEKKEDKEVLLGVWKPENQYKGLTMAQFKKTFYKLKAVPITQKEKEILEERYEGKFAFFKKNDDFLKFKKKYVKK